MGIARIDSAGAIDTTFSGDGYAYNSGGAGDTTVAVAIQSDGKPVVVGQSTTSKRDIGIARYNTNGTNDNTFSGDGKAILAVTAEDNDARDVALQPDDKAVVVGREGDFAPYDTFIARFDTAGVADATFAGGAVEIDFGGDDDLNAVGVLSTGEIVAGGETDGQAVLAYYNADGTPVASIGTNGIVTLAALAPVKDLVVQSDDRIIFGGDGYVARATRFGALDSAFDGDGQLTHDPTPDADTFVRLALADSGEVVVVDNTLEAGNWESITVTRYAGFTEETVEDYVPVTMDWDAGTSMFGACLRQLNGANTSAQWTEDADNDCTAFDTDPWQPLPQLSGAGAIIARTTAAGTQGADVRVRFGLRFGATQAAGTYSAPLTWEVVAPDV